jgi:SAM-dependent methyltransferase
MRNGSISAWLAERVSPGGKAVAFDLDLSLIIVRAPNLELRQGDIVAAPVDRHSFDLVTARAVLHHVANTEAAIGNLIASLRPDGALLLIEPDFLPVSIAEPPEVRAFWDGWVAWSRERGIDYQIGRTLAPRLAALGLTQINGTAETAIYNGGSPWADYWMQTITELRDDLTGSGKLNDTLGGHVSWLLYRLELVDSDYCLHRSPWPYAWRVNKRRCRPFGFTQDAASTGVEKTGLT